jgi:hypothetical protein
MSSTIKQEFYLKRRDGTVFKGGLDLIRVSDTDRDAFEVEGLKGRYIIASTDIPVKGIKRSSTPDELIEEYEEVSRAALDSQEDITKKRAASKAESRKVSVATSKEEKRKVLVEFFKSGDLYNKNKELFLLKEGFDPDSVG